MSTESKASEMRIVAELIASPGKHDALRSVLLLMIGPSNAEAGCRQYELHEDRENPARFVFIERWVDEAAFEFHTRTAHFSALGPAIAPLLAEPVRLNKLKYIG